MPIKAVCRTCFKEYSLKEALAGKKVKCRECGEAFRVPTESQSAEVQEVDEFLDSDTPPPTPVRRASNTVPAPKQRASKKPGIPVWTILALIGGGALILFVILCVGLPLLFVVGGRGIPGPQPVGFQPDMRMPPGPPGMPGFPGQALVTPAGDPDSLFPLASVPLPKFPDLGVARTLPGSHIRIHDLSLGTANPGESGPGTGMNLRVYLPGDQAARSSQGCVLVAPAGTNLIVGNDLDDANYHAETLPYAQAGYVTIMFSLDGGVRDLSQMSNLELAAAYRKFSAAHAGLVNARNALEFALAKLPQIDPQRIYIAGHSSAAVLALLFAEHEPRLKGCIAYAAASDVEERLSDLTRTPRVDLLLPGIRNFVRRSSPRTHMGQMNCPVFLFHAADDSNEPIRTAIRFTADLQRLGKSVVFEQVPRGDHYDSMIQEGIPRAIMWLGH